jgi:dethiobiotin synthetase
MAPIDDNHTGLDLMALLGHPLILVTGSYLGALSHTLTALYTLRGRSINVSGIIISESESSVGLGDTLASLRQFAGADLPMYALPRLTGNDQAKWRTAPSLTALCAGEDDEIRYKMSGSNSTHAR